jgi:prephenate dehydrogenase
VRIGLIGFGLIGGSIARAVHDRPGPRWSIAAWSPTGAGPREALGLGIIDEASTTAGGALLDADLVVIAAPPIASIEIIADLGGSLRGFVSSQTVITDVASTKERIMEAASAAGIRFVGGHPMAGRDTSGFDAADPALFVGRPWVVVRGDATDDDVRRVEELAQRVGARPIALEAARHDAAVAGISHLPLVLSAALVEAVVGAAGEPERDDWQLARDLAASGWRDMTRLARGQPEMGVGIALSNAAALAERVRDVQAVLDVWLEMLERQPAPDAAMLDAHLRGARSRLVEPR